MSEWLNRIHFGDCLETLRRMPDGIVQTCVTSPPYFGLRDYGHPQQIGLEATPEEFVARLVEVFREVRRVLRDDGTCWVNMGDTYAGSGRGGNPGGSSTLQGSQLTQDASMVKRTRDDVSSAQRCNAPRAPGDRLRVAIGEKQLMGIPWRLAFALQADGWCLRQDIIWNKPNPMPESVQDRCTKAHEYVFFLSKGTRYYFDQEAIAEPVASSTTARLAQDVDAQTGSARVPGKTNGTMKAKPPRFGGQKYGDHQGKEHQTKSGNEYTGNATGMRNRRSVWTVSTKPYKGAHFATFPPELVEPCILAGAPAGGVVLDPFFGSGTTGEVAQRLGRAWIGCELNPDYGPLQQTRLMHKTPGLELA